MAVSSRWRLSAKMEYRRCSPTYWRTRCSTSQSQFQKNREGDSVPLQRYHDCCCATHQLRQQYFTQVCRQRQRASCDTARRTGCVNQIATRFPDRPFDTVRHCGGISRWDVASGGRMGQVMGEDAVEVAPPPTVCTHQCQAQNRVRGQSTVLGFPFPVALADQLKSAVPSAAARPKCGRPVRSRKCTELTLICSGSAMGASRGGHAPLHYRGTAGWPGASSLALAWAPSHERPFTAHGFGRRPTGRRKHAGSPMGSPVLPLNGTRQRTTAATSGVGWRGLKNPSASYWFLNALI